MCGFDFIDLDLISISSTSLHRSVNYVHLSASFEQYPLRMSARTDAEADAVQETTGITPESLTTKLSHKLEASHVDISDLSGSPPCVSLLPAFDDLMSFGKVAAAKCSKR